MTAKTYSAGTIFLQVVPVFGDTMHRIKREAKQANDALGDEMEKGGRDAGRRGSKAMGEELGKTRAKVKVDVDTDLGDFETRMRAAAKRAGNALGNSISPEIKKIRAELKTMG